MAAKSYSFPLSCSTDELIEEAKNNPPVPIVDCMVNSGDVLLIHGEEATLKSSFSLELAVSIATGQPFLGQLGVQRTLRVGYVATEERVGGLGTKLRHRFPEQRPPNLFFMHSQALTAFRKTFEFNERLSLVREFVQRIKCEALFLDVIGDLFCGGLNPDKEQDVAKVMEGVTSIPGLKLWVLLRHDGKPREGLVYSNSNNRIRGSGRWKELPDTIIHLQKDSDNSPTVKVAIGKFRYGNKPVPWSIRFDKGKHTIASDNPLPEMLLGGSFTRQQLVEDCHRRFKVSPRTVDRWLSAVKDFLTEEQKGHEKVYRMDKPISFAKRKVWCFPAYEDDADEITE